MSAVRNAIRADREGKDPSHDRARRIAVAERADRLVVKAGTPDAIVARLNDAVNRSLAAEAAQTTLRQLSSDVGPGTLRSSPHIWRVSAADEEIARLAHVEVE
jgi:hypothetical protein